MSISQNQRRRGRSGGSGVSGRGSVDSANDALAELRQALTELDPTAFARCFSANGWLRVPRLDGDLVRHGPSEIEHLGHEMRVLLLELTWVPSQRFVSAGQVVEEAVAWVRPTGNVEPAVQETASDHQGEQVRIPMRVVAALDPAGGIGSLTLWVDWAALNDPQGVDSAHGAASALIARARARDNRGLRVFEGETHVGPAVAPVAAVPPPRVPASTRPPAVVLWWRQHRATLAGSTMALAAAAVIGWVAMGALRPILDERLSSNTTAPSAGSVDVRGAATSSPVAKPTSRPTASDLPVIIPEKPQARPKEQAGDEYPFEADLLFQSGSTHLTANARVALREMAKTIRDKNVSGTIQVNGYTDDVGSTAYNLKLSRDRALAVAQGLRQELSGVRLTLKPQGFGEPPVPDTTVAGRAKDRKVVIILPKPRKAASTTSRTP